MVGHLEPVVKVLLCWEAFLVSLLKFPKAPLCSIFQNLSDCLPNMSPGGPVPVLLRQDTNCHGRVLNLEIQVSLGELGFQPKTRDG